MDLTREFSMPDMMMLCGVSEFGVRKLMADGLLTPTRRGRNMGRGRSLHFDLRSIVVVGLLKSLRAKGATLQYALPLAKFVGQLTPAELDAAASADKLLCYAGATLPPCLRSKDDLQVEYHGQFNELLFQAEVKQIWQLVHVGLDYNDRITTAPLADMAMRGIPATT